MVANSAIRVVGRLDPAEARARRVRVPVTDRASAGGDPQAGVDDALPAADPGAARRSGSRSRRGRPASSEVAPDPATIRSRGSSDEDPAHRRLARRQDPPPPPAARRGRQAVLAEVVADRAPRSRSTSCSSAATCSTSSRRRPRPSGSSTRARRPARDRRPGARDPRQPRQRAAVRSASRRLFGVAGIRIVPEVRAPRARAASSS